MGTRGCRVRPFAGRETEVEYTYNWGRNPLKATMEDTQSTEDSQNSETVEQTEVTQDASEQNPLAAKLEEVEAKNRQLFERAKKAEEQLKKTKAGSSDASDVDLDAFKSELRDEVSLQVSGYTEEEIAKIRAYAKGYGKRLGEVKDDPFIQAAIMGLRDKKKSEDATPAPSSRVASTPSKANKPTSEMTPAERQAHFEKRSRDMAGKRRSYT